MSNPDEFTEEQKNYLQGFLSGLEVNRAVKGLSSLSKLIQTKSSGAAHVSDAGSQGPGTEASTPAAPEAIHFEAQNRFLAEGKKLSAEEQAKREKNPLDMWEEIQKHAQEKRFPKGTDIFKFKFHGLFYVAPAQDAFMCRLRIPNGILNTYQFRGIANLAERFGGGYTHVTTRANLQIRELKPEDGVKVLVALQDIGIINRGAGADNIRNITGDPTAGIDPQELIDTRALSRALYYHILYHRELYGLPRKFNIAFDGGGTVSVLTDTNDIGFAAVRVAEGRQIPAGVYFRLQLGGITGHKDFARDTGVLVKPEECVPVAGAIVRVFIDSGDRTDRKKARLKYLLDRWGLEKYLEETEKYLSFKLRRFPLDQCEPRAPLIKHAHIGFHPQRQPGLYYLGVVLPVGKMSVQQMRGLSAIADRYGSGTLRLTVWQNLLISDIPERHLAQVKQAVEGLGLHWSTTNIRAGLVACTGNTGCKFSASDTKGNAMRIAEYLDKRIALEQPINIHLTGCPNSCAQHYIGDIGLLGVKVEANDDMVEGYDIYVGGGSGAVQNLAREVYTKVLAEDVLVIIERMLRAYVERRHDKSESFLAFTCRHSVEALKTLFEAQTSKAA